MGRSMDLNATTVLLRACSLAPSVGHSSGTLPGEMPLMAAIKGGGMQVNGVAGGGGSLMGSGPAVEIKIDDPGTEKARLEAIERASEDHLERDDRDGPD